VHGRGRARLGVALVVIMAAALLGHRLGQAPFDDPGEGMHAEIARELTRGHDPFALTLSGVRYVDKPPLLYALIGLTFRVAGESEFTARLVPALAGVAAVAATAWLGIRLLGTAGGMLAGLALLTCVGFFAYGRYVRPDSLFVAALAWGFALVLVGMTEQRRRLVGCGILVFGVAALAKDPLGLLGPLAIVTLAVLLVGRGRELGRWLPWWSVLAALLMAFGWWVIQEVRTPGYIWYTVVDNHLRNVARSRLFPDEDVPLTALQFLTVASLAAVPWIVAATATVVRLARRRAWRDAAELPWIALALWALGVFVATVASPFRLPHYGLPAYPAVALLAARAWRQSRSRGLVIAHAVGLAALAVACTLAWRSDGEVFMTRIMETTDVASRKSAVMEQASPLPPWAEFQGIFGNTVAVFTVGALGAGAVASRRRFAARAGAVPTIVTMLALMPLVATALSLVATHRAVRSLGLEIARRAAARDVVAHEGPLENSGALEWYSARRPVIIDGRRSVLAFAASRLGEADTFWDPDTARARWGTTDRIWAVTTRDPAHSLVARLPGARVVAAAGGRWLYLSPAPDGASNASTVAKP
jgi:Dolichyl-phosphate-mannose-protein mannosyltransferase